MKKRVLSGIRATGRLHLGNYLGALKGMLELQDDPEYETLYMVADLHTITTPYSIDELRKNRREIVIDYLAAGLDPEKSILFVQSDVNEHGQLAFLFSSVESIARMQHLPTFKEKVKQHPDHVTMALLNYPILMAADILIYKAGLVPVGIDQEPHLEVAREVARKMNQEYKTDFPEPVRFKTAGEYVPSLTGEGKMSKTVEGSYINMVDDLETIRRKIAKVPTDSGMFARGYITPVGPISEQSIQGGGNVKNVVSDSKTEVLLKLAELFEGIKRRRQLEEQYNPGGGGLRYSEVKEELSQAIYVDLKGFQEKRRELESRPDYVDSVIRDGAEKARRLAAETLREVREKMGLL